MDSLSPQVVFATKLPILNPNEFDLWKMRIEQYFLTTDYSLWEVILNGDSPIPTRIVEDAKTLMEAIEKRFGGNTKTKKVQKTLLKQQFENFTGSNSEGLDQIHDRLQNLVSQLKIHEIDVDDLEEMDLKWQMVMLTMRARRFLQKTGRNIGANGPTSMWFDMSKVECYNCHRKGHFARECRSLKDSRRPGATELQRRTVPVETSTSNALVSQCDGTGGYDWSYQAEEGTANFALMAFSSNSSSDNETCIESIEARLLVYKQNESVFEENIKLLNIEVQLRDAALGTLRHKLEKAEKERDDIKLKLEKFQTSSKNLTDLLASQTNKKTGLGYNHSGGYHVVPPPYTGTFMPPKPDLVFNTAPTPVKTDHIAFNVRLSPTRPAQDLSHTARPSAPIIKDWVSDSKEDSETKVTQFVPSFAQSSEHVKSPRHSAQPIETTILAATPVPASPKSNSSGKRRNRKACFVCKSVDHLIKDCDYHTKKMAQPTSRTYAYMGHHKQYAPLTHLKPQKHRIPTVVFTQSKPVPVVSVVQGKQGTWGNPQQVLQDKGVNDSGCSRHMTGNMSYLSDFEEINRGYVAFGGNPNGGKITGKGKIKTVLLRVPRENNMYNVNLKNIVPSEDLTCLFAKATIDESNLLHRRLGYINFKTINKLVKHKLVRGLPTKVFENDNSYVACKKGKQHRAFCKTKPVSTVDQPLFSLYMDLFGPTLIQSINKKSYCLVIIDDYSRFTWVFFLATKDETTPILKTFLTGLENQLSLKVKNNAEDAAFDGKEYDFDVKKPESKVILSPNINAQSKEQDDKTKKEAKGKSPVEFTTRYRDLNAEFQDCSENRSNEVNAASFTVPIVGQKSLNNTNTFSANEFEDIIYSNDEDVVGVEVDFNNLECSIPVSPIPTTRIHKDHHVSQIISDLSSTTQTRSMTRAVKDQGKAKEGWHIFSQDKYVAEILQKFGHTEGKSASTPIDINKHLLKDPNGEDVDVHTYSAMDSESIARLWTNDVTRLQALVDKKRVVITEATIRDTLHLGDAEGVDCLPNDEIFAELARMSYRSHQQSLHSIRLSSQASGSRKFNFSKYIFESLVRNVDNSSKFYMYPRVGKGFSGVETPLFEGMLVGVIEEQGDAEEQDLPSTSQVQHTPPQSHIPQLQPSPPAQPQAADFPMSLLQEALNACAALTRRVEHLEYDKVSQALEITKPKRRVKKLEKENKVKVLKLRRLKKKAEKAQLAGDDQVKRRQAEIYQIDMDHALNVLKVVTTASESVTTASTTIAAEPQVPPVTITAIPVRVDAASTRRRKGVVIRDPEEESTTIIPTDTKSKDKEKGIMVEEPKPLKKKQQVKIDEEYARKLHEELNKDIDWNVAIDHVKQKAKEDPFVQRYHVIKKRPLTEAKAQRNMIMYLKNVAGFRLDYFKGMSYDDIHLIFEAKFNSNIEFLLKKKEQLEEEKNRAIQSINETLAQKAAKRRKLKISNSIWRLCLMKTMICIQRLLH
nr:ribonuclease H-like domain-containing protein [Tanacetum cinerariifolium]